jgi:hypothetical protein
LFFLAALMVLSPVPQRRGAVNPTVDAGSSG